MCNYAFPIGHATQKVKIGKEFAYLTYQFSNSYHRLKTVHNCVHFDKIWCTETRENVQNLYLQKHDHQVTENTRNGGRFRYSEFDLRVMALHQYGQFFKNCKLGHTQ